MITMDKPHSHIVIDIQWGDEGISRIEPNISQIQKDLTDHSEVLLEAYQTIMRKNNINGAYEIIKNYYKRFKTNEDILKNMLDDSVITKELYDELIKITVMNYDGV